MSPDGTTTVLIIPCYNESDRLQPASFLEVLESQPASAFPLRRRRKHRPNLGGPGSDQSQSAGEDHSPEIGPEPGEG